ncbi:hypothetical protein OIU34_18035 [Pararhizobium sp. BT-229]|uniref:hypothetical protein n=1 Tax=Pararhizobium sp. BT-229 TaxID=2986923 RepID=UPI0021F76587|nr:hypothetical protein [Pararhizobium sp. BT-229]MCV9963779.1 hypothetical protein [Pararhizobium sp. BT-229]
MENLLITNSRSSKGNEQAMGSQAAPTTYNIVAKLLGWGQGGVATVEVLTDVPGVSLGAEMKARVAEDRKRLKLKDFAFWKSKGLRVTGAVLLRNAVIDPELGIVCREVYVMRDTQKDGPCIVKRHSAVYIHAPESASTLVVKHATVAVLADARRAKSVEECVTLAKRMVEDAAILGEPSLLLTVAEPSGRIEELPIKVPAGADGDAIEAAVRTGIDPDSAKMMARSKAGWWLVPMFTAELESDPYIRGKLNAQYANIKYGPPEEPMWTRTNAVLRGTFSDFIIADVSPTAEPTDNEPQLLVDLLGG